MATVDDELEHLTTLHKIELMVISKNEKVSQIPNRHYNPSTKKLLDKINEKLSTTYVTESTTMTTGAFTDIFDDVNKHSHIDLTYHQAFMKFFQQSELDTYSDYAKDYLNLLVLAF